MDLPVKDKTMEQKCEQVQKLIERRKEKLESKDFVSQTDEERLGKLKNLSSYSSVRNSYYFYKRRMDYQRRQRMREEQDEKPDL